MTTRSRPFAHGGGSPPLSPAPGGATSRSAGSPSASTERLEQLRARRIEVSKQRTKREAELESAREDLARTVAEGQDADQALARVRSLTEKVDALKHAGPYLDRDLEIAEEADRRARIRAADAEADRLAAEAEETVEALAGAITVAAEELSKLAARAEDLSRRSRRADVRAARLADRRAPRVGRAAKAWQDHPLLPEVIHHLRAFAAGGFDALQRKERERRAAMAGQAS